MSAFHILLLDNLLSLVDREPLSFLSFLFMESRRERGREGRGARRRRQVRKRGDAWTMGMDRESGDEKIERYGERGEREREREAGERREKKRLGRRSRV